MSNKDRQRAYSKKEATNFVAIQPSLMVSYGGLKKWERTMKKNMLISLAMLGGLSVVTTAIAKGEVLNLITKDLYTPLMEASSLAETKELVKNGADINALIWQYDWGHYVTALDCANYNYGLKPTDDNLARVKFLEQMGAKSARQLLRHRGR